MRGTWDSFSYSYFFSNEKSKEPNNDRGTKKSQVDIGLIRFAWIFTILTMPSNKFDSTPISLSVCDIQPISEYPESVNCSPRPSVTLQMVAAKKLSMSSRRSSRKSLGIGNDEPWAQERLGKRRCAKTVSMACVSYRLTKRKELHRLW